MELKNHQKECIDKIEENFIKNKKGLIKMFCGSGKSLIIYHSLLNHILFFCYLKYTICSTL